MWKTIFHTYVCAPSSEIDWLTISDGFLEDWNTVHCIRAIDGKHIAIECINNSGLFYHNYKGLFRGF